MDVYVKRLAALLLVAGGLLLGAASFSQPAYAQFNPLDKACTDAGSSSAACQDKDDPDSITGRNGIIVRVTNIVATVAGVAAVLVIVIYGIMIVISYGDSGKVTQARNAIIGAAAGLIVIALARTIVVFVVNRL